MRARLLLNPAAGRGRGARRCARLEALARAAGIGFETSTSAGDLVERARRAAEEGVERLLVAGGDGTWHWAAQGLAGSATALAPIALGTGNDLARELGFPLDAEAAFRSALAGELARIDLGLLGGRRFCGVAGVGFDAAVAEYARTRVRRLRGPAVYAWATIATLATYRSPAVTLVTDGGEYRGEVFFVAFANTSHYGGGMRIAPGADPADGRIEIVVVRRCSKLRLLGVFPRVYRGGHVGHPAVTLLSATRGSLEIRPAQLINADGEGLGRTGEEALAIGVEPGALAVVRAPDMH
ncbi:MAG TPA: diacylglycerol kinase family protein [Thermoanaerobaculia bacterium]|nr:diacylglycerol kinase family protein [Thermoanaerobaculia bacterium]